jgi:hypothetical protein
MSTPTTERQDFRGLLGWMFVGRPPDKPPGRVGLALVLLGFPVWCFIALTWWAINPLLTVATFFVFLSGVLGTLGRLASYHRWRGDRPGELLRLSSGLAGTVWLALVLAHIALNGQWGWLWWASFVVGLTTVVVVAGYYYGPNGGSDAEGTSSAGRGPSN